jgi:hypothetical protein
MGVRPAGAPLVTYPSVPAQNQITPTAPPPPTRTPIQSTPVSMSPQYAPYYQQPGYGAPYGSGPWSYQYGGQLAPRTAQLPAPQGPVYYQTPPPASANHDTNQVYGYAPPPLMYRGRSHANLQWQPSYTGPRANLSPNQIHYYQYPPLPQQSPSTIVSTNTQ